MTPRQFDAITDLCRICKPESVSLTNALFQVLIHEVPGAAAARAWNVEANNVYKKAKRYREAHAKLLAAYGE